MTVGIINNWVDLGITGDIVAPGNVDIIGNLDIDGTTSAWGPIALHGGINVTTVNGVNAGSASCGQAQLVIGPGAVTINTTAVKATSLIFVSHADAMGSSALYVLSSEIVPGVSFTVHSNGGGGNADVFNWLLINPI